MSKASDEVNLLWPYLLPKIQRVVSGSGGGGSSGSVGVGGAPSPHDLDGPHHTGVLANAQAPQFLLMDGTRNLTGDLAVNTGITIDGVDLSAHVADPDAHHDRATVGNTGLSISGQQLSLNLATNSGLAISSGVLVDRAEDFTWTGTHQFNVDPQINANLDFIGGDRTITSSSDLTLAPVDNLVINPGGNLVLAANDIEWRSNTIGDLPTGISGWRLWDRGGNETQLTITAIKADELRVRFFIADAERVSLGSELWGKSRGITSEDFVVPADEATVDVWFESIAALPGFDIFEVNDWILFRTIDVSGGGLDVEKIWFQVSAAKLADDVTDDGVSIQQWRLRRKSGGTTGATVKKTAVVPDLGVVGDGMVDLSALKSDGGPFVRTSTFDSVLSDVPQFLAHTQMGNLTGTVDYTTDIYGFAAGNNLGLAPSAGFSGMAAEATNGLRLFNTDLEIYDSSALVLDLKRATGLRLIQDTDFLDHDYAYVGWFTDLTVSGDLRGYVASGGDATDTGLQVISQTEATGGNAAVDIEALSFDSGDSAAIQLRSVSGGQIVMAVSGASGFVEIETPALNVSDRINVGGDIIPTVDVASDLGSASLQWNTIYTNNLIVSGAVSGASIGGQTWTYPGSMVIDADNGADTTVSVTNSGAGRADLDVDRNITLGGTVDGVDVGSFKVSYDSLSSNYTSHIADANAHHNQSHVLATGTALGSDHTMSGAAAGEVLRAIDATHAAFDQLQHSDLGGVSANQHHNQSHVLATTSALGGDHTVSGLTAGMVLKATSATAARWIALDHSELTGVTANQHHNQQHSITGSDHTGTGAALSVVGFSATNTLGVLVPSSDVSAGVAALLKSTPAGGLGLASAFTTGAVDVGQGFTAGNNTIRMIYHTGGTPHTHMVINPTGLWSLDEQFGLDIDDNLLVRGWIVGKHAIQVADARMLAHYDGPEPIQTNYVGDPTGHMGQVGTLNGGAIFRGGKFGKALQTGEATTNLITNPSFEVNTAGWTALGGTSVFALRSTPTTTGNFSVSFSSSTAFSDELRSPNISFTSGTTYTFSLDVKASSGSQAAEWVVRFATGGVGQANFIVFAPASDWTRLSASLVAPSTGTYYISIYNRISTFSRILIDSVQVEAKAYATPYCDGSLGNGHAWTGTAHASSSTRTAGHVAYSDPVFDDMQSPLTVMAWIKPTSLSSFQTIISKEDSGNTLGWEMSNSTGTLRATLRNATVNVTAGALVQDAWQFAAFTYDRTDLNLYLNGVLTGTAAGSSDLDSTAAVLVGRRASGSNFNGFIDEVSLIDRALTADEIRAIYESGAPIFAETSTFQWRAGRNRIYADSEGLWGYGASGATILGLYAGDDTNPSATKSWGGLSLSEGDLLLGRYGAADGGWLYFDQDLVGGDPGLTFGYGDDEVLRLDSGGASLTGVLDIDSAGGIYQGTGTFASPTTGLKIYNSSGVGKLSTYNSGVEQVKFDTDGRLYAGAGNVRLDAGGLIIKASTTFTDVNSYTFGDGSFNVVSGVKAAYPSGQNVVGLIANEVASRASSIQINSFSPTGQASSVALTTFVNSVIQTSLGMSSSGGTVTVTPQLTAQQNSTTGAKAPIVLDQFDADQPMIQFVGAAPAAGTSQNFSTDAAGTYRGKIQVLINGTKRWIPYYD